MSNEIARYEADGSEVVLTDQNIRELISTDKNVSDKEIMLFAALCKSQHLNPFIKEAYLIKYGNKPAQMVVGKDVFIKRAYRNNRFKGYEAGLSIQTNDGRMIRRDGSMRLPNETIVGGWCRVFIDGYEKPMFDEVAFEEYAGKDRNGNLTNIWRDKGGTMIRKVAICHALREAFPEDLSGLYGSEEMNVQEPVVEAAELEVEEF